MKKNKKVLRLEKIEVAKLTNLNRVYGGATLLPGCGTDGPDGNQNQRPKCKENSDIIIGTDTNEI